MTADEHRTDVSGADLDAWGGEVTTPILIPRPGDHCVIQEYGRCPPGCRQCQQFAEDMGIVNDGKDGGHEEKFDL